MLCKWLLCAVCNLTFVYPFLRLLSVFVFGLPRPDFFPMFLWSYIVCLFLCFWCWFCFFVWHVLVHNSPYVVFVKLALSIMVHYWSAALPTSATGLFHSERKCFFFAKWRTQANSHKTWLKKFVCCFAAGCHVEWLGARRDFCGRNASAY